MFISILVSVSFPAKSLIVIVSFVFPLYSFVNTFLSSDNVHPSTSCISSFDVSITITLSFVVSFVLYSTFTSGTVLSIFSTFIFIFNSFPFISRITIVSSAFSLYSFVNSFLFSDNSQPSISSISSFVNIVTFTFSFVGFFVLYSIVFINPSLSMLFISIFASVSFPTISLIVIISFVFSLYSFVNTFLSSDNVQPSTSCTSSFDVIVTFTFSLVNSCVLYSTFTSGPTLSMLFISISAFVSFPAKSFIVIVSLIFSPYSFVSTFLSSANVQPSISCISSFAFIVTTTLFAGSFVLYSTFTFGSVLSNLNPSLLVIVSFPRLSSAYIHKYHIPSASFLVIFCPFSKLSIKLSFASSPSLCVHKYFKLPSSTPTTS